VTAKIILELESDAETALKWLGTEAKAGLVAVEELAMPLIEAAEPTVIAEVKAGVTAFLSALASVNSPTLGGAIEDIMQAFIEDLESTGSTLLPTVQSLASSILQAIIALAKAAVAAA
jgi:hypothetical protein